MNPCSGAPDPCYGPSAVGGSEGERLSSRGRKRLIRVGRAPLVALLLLFALAAPALGAFPGTNPGESVRINTPNDPDFDRCEPDDAQGATCTNTFGQQYERFGFAPNGSQATALYHNPTDPHVQRHSAQNTLAGRIPLGQVPGVSADRAWKYSTGAASVQVAILDTGIRWSNSGLRKKVALNRAELPLPGQSGPCAQYDCNSDGAFNVDDYASDPRVSATTGHDDEPGADAFLDASDLIVVAAGVGVDRAALQRGQRKLGGNKQRGARRQHHDRQQGQQGENDVQRPPAVSLVAVAWSPGPTPGRLKEGSSGSTLTGDGRSNTHISNPFHV